MSEATLPEKLTEEERDEYLEGLQRLIDHYEWSVTREEVLAALMSLTDDVREGTLV